MKKLHYYKIIIFFIISFLIINKGESQVLINSSGGTPDPSSILEVRSTTQGLLIPRMNTTERTSINNPADGLLVFDSQQNSFYIFGDNKWNDLSTPAGIWETSSSNVYLSSSYTNVGIGTINPDGKLVIKADKSKGPDDALFEIQDADGETIFEVTSEGARIYVKDYPNSKGVSGGFAVGRYGTAKGIPGETFFMVTPDSTRVYTRDSKKGVSGGFAVGRYGTAKGVPDTLFFKTDLYGTKVSVFEDKTKGVSGGFAVGRYGTAKDSKDSLFFYTTIDSTRVYTDGRDSKGVAGGFAVGRYGTAKGGSNNYMYMIPDNYFIGHQSGDSLQNSTYTGKYNTFFGYQTGLNDTSGSNNVFIGHQSGLTNNEGNDNVFLGTQSGYSNTRGDYNVFLGNESGFSNSTGIYNTCVGYLAGNSHTNGDQNTFIGAGSGAYGNGGFANTFIGLAAGLYATGDNNVYMGKDTGKGTLTDNNTGDNNVFIGNKAGRTNIDGDYNVFLGYESGDRNSDGSNNVFLGYYSGNSNKLGAHNIFIGNTAGFSNIGNGTSTNGQSNVFIGDSAGYSQTAGYNNTFLGTKVGLNCRSGSDNIFIGVEAGNYTESAQNNIFLGNNAGAGSAANANKGEENIFIGTNAGSNNIYGTNNVFLGNQVGLNNSLGENNVFLGNLAGYSNIGNGLYEGANNIYIGYKAAYENEIGYGNVFVGQQAGELNEGGSNVLIGQYAAYVDVTGEMNVVIGAQSAMNKTAGDHNVIIGNGSGSKTENGEMNVFIGKSAANNYNATAGGTNALNSNVVIGFAASFLGVGTNNVIIGTEAGYSLTPTTSTGNVFLGYKAGRYETSSNKFYIANTGGTSLATGIANSLMYGNFSTEDLRINAELSIYDEYSFPVTFGTIGQVLVAQGDGNQLIWSNASDLDDGDWTVSGSNMYSAVTGNVGIGISPSSSVKFHIDNTTTDYGIYSNSHPASGTAYGVRGNATGVATNYGIYGYATGGTTNWAGYFNGNVYASGNMGLGTTSPSSKLEVYGATQNIEISNSSETESGLIFNDSGASTTQYAKILFNSASTNELDFYINSTTPIMTISRYNHLGIGTESPTNHLHVEEAISGSATPTDHVTQIKNTTTGTSGDVLALVLANSADPTSGNNFITFFRGNTTGVGAIEGDGNGGITLNTSGADYAEYLQKIDISEQFQKGDIVGIYGGKISKNTDNADMIMAISTAPIILGNNPGENEINNYEQVGFMGQVPVNVIGTVNEGDYIIASGNNDGIGFALSENNLKPEHYNQILGIAWESSIDINLKQVLTGIGINLTNKLLQKQYDKINKIEENNKILSEKNIEIQNQLTDMQKQIIELKQLIQNK